VLGRGLHVREGMLWADPEQEDIRVVDTFDEAR
jgi:hypothetical protein